MQGLQTLKTSDGLWQLREINVLAARNLVIPAGETSADAHTRRSNPETFGVTCSARTARAAALVASLSAVLANPSQEYLEIAVLELASKVDSDTNALKLPHCTTFSSAHASAAGQPRR